MATLKINLTQVEAQIRKQAAKRLIKAAAFLQAFMQQKLNVANPPPHLTPSAPGEYPRKRTGNLQAGVMYDPNSPSEVERTLEVIVGYAAQAFYGIALANRGWKSIQDAANECRPQLRKILEGG